MRLDFLQWYKDLEYRLRGQPGLHLLLSSAVDEPTELLHKHLKQFADEQFESRINVPIFRGHQRLIKNIGKRYNADPENILITRGASNAIYLVCRAFLAKDDHVIIESPAYEPLIASPEFINTKITYLKRRPPDYSFDLNELNSAVTSKTKLVLITNLHNPSGAYLDNDVLLKAATVVKNRNENVKIVVDEIYRDFVPGDSKPIAAFDDCFISLNSLTKVYGLGVIHSGWLIAGRHTISVIKRLQILTEGSGSRFLESLIALIIENLDEYLNRSLEIVSRNREIICQYMKPLFNKEILTGDIPFHGCIYFPRIVGINNTRQLVESMIEKYRIYTVPGHFFGEPGHIRIGFGTKPEIFEKDLQLFVEVIASIIRQR